MEFERTFGVVTGHEGAHFTKVMYIHQGVEYDTLVENEDISELGWLDD